MASLIQQKMHQIADLFRGTQERKLPANSVIHNSKTLQAPADEDVSFDYAYKSTYLSGMMGNGIGDQTNTALTGNLLHNSCFSDTRRRNDQCI